jgi:hypothetical protein
MIILLILNENFPNSAPPGDYYNSILILILIVRLRDAKKEDRLKRKIKEKE